MLRKKKTRRISQNYPGVSRYLEKQAQFALDNPVEVKVIPNVEEEVDTDIIEKCLEGEFIPANEFIASNPTGVSRYLEKQGAVVNITKESAQEKITGVSRYLEKQVESVKDKLAVVPLTGVDRYMLKKAS